MWFSLYGGVSIMLMGAGENSFAYSKRNYLLGVLIYFSILILFSFLRKDIRYIYAIAILILFSLMAVLLLD